MKPLSLNDCFMSFAIVFVLLLFFRLVEVLIVHGGSLSAVSRLVKASPPTQKTGRPGAFLRFPRESEFRYAVEGMNNRGGGRRSSS